MQALSVGKTMLNMRPYQDTILDKLREGFRQGHKKQVLYAPCGAGKTEMAVSLMHAAATNPKGIKRSAMIVDRRILCEQTSARLWGYQIDHGVLMAGSNRWRPELPIQVCTAQTIEARESFPAVSLLIVDEAHCIRESTIDFIRQHPEMHVIGLSGSPFTKGMGAIYEHVVSAVTIAEMVADSWLIAPRIFVAKEIDMKGAKKVAGEWSAAEATKRGIQITGDVVAEWVKKTHEIFGAPRKTIVFCAGVVHGEDLAKQFGDAGYNFVSISYRDDDEYKQEVLAEFDKPDTEINGIIATDILTKGFDQSDVMIGISARPFSKSFSSHVQQLGRVMRPHQGKDQAIWLDHSGNVLRFRGQWENLYHNGVDALDDGAEKSKPEPSDKEKEASKCPGCGYLWSVQDDVCPNCGHVRTRRNDVIEIAGEMHELGVGTKADKYDVATKERWFQELLGYARATGKKDGWSWFKYQEKFKVKPPWKKIAREPSEEVERWVRSRNIAWAKRRT